MSQEPFRTRKQSSFQRSQEPQTCLFSLLCLELPAHPLFPAPAVQLFYQLEMKTKQTCFLPRDCSKGHHWPQPAASTASMQSSAYPAFEQHCCLGQNQNHTQGFHFCPQNILIRKQFEFLEEDEYTSESTGILFWCCFSLLWLQELPGLGETAFYSMGEHRVAHTERCWSVL